MENYSYSSYPDSGDSSPRSREIDCENASWDEPPNYRVKFMCSYGGKISPRPHDNQLSYVGGDTKILTVDRTIRFPTIISKLSSLVDADACFKYQLPGEDLDALISVTNDEDLEHMMLEYDRLHRASAKPARLRLFLFPLTQPPISAAFTESAPPPSDAKSDRQWFVDALNSAPIQSIDAVTSPPASAAASNPDFLFGFDKGTGAAAAAAAKVPEPMPELTVPEVPPPRSELPKEDRQIGVESTAEIQRQIQELQRLQIQDQARVYDYYQQQKPQEKAAPPPPPQAAVSMQVPVPMPSSYWPERQMQQPPPPTAVTMQASAPTGADQPVYLFPQQMYRPPVTGQGYYVQRMMPDVYRESPMYGMGAPPPQMAQVGRQQGLGEAGGGAYTGVAYDSAGRQVYYTAQGGVVPTYQTVTASSVDMRQMAGGGGMMGQDGKVVKPPPSS